MNYKSSFTGATPCVDIASSSDEHMHSILQAVVTLNALVPAVNYLQLQETVIGTCFIAKYFLDAQSLNFSGHFAFTSCHFPCMVETSKRQIYLREVHCVIFTSHDSQSDTNHTRRGDVD